MATMKKIPVHIVTGFLGSGKTTFLNHFIQELLPERILVIENECGDTNIDGALVMESVEEVVEMSAGCLCCSLSDSLLDILEVISERRSSFDRVVIETTGIADPGPIVQVFLAMPGVSRIFELEQVICLADAGLLEDWLQETEEALRQLSMADVILINKADTVSSSYLPVLGAHINQINPNALVLTGNHGNFPVATILGEGILKPESVEKKLATTEHHHDHSTHEHHHETINNDHQITTFTLVFDRPFRLDDHFSLFLHRLINLYRDQVYRVKGIIHVEGHPNRVILQSVRTTCVATDGSAWQQGEEKISKLVFIGKGLKRDVFEHMVAKYVVPQREKTV